MASTINASTSAGIIQTADTSGVLALQTGGTTALTINTTGSVAFGTSSTAYGTSGQVLTSNGNAVPTWSAPPASMIYPGAGVAVSNGSAWGTSLTAASANTANALVQRDGSGNFSAGTITAALSGNAATATNCNSANAKWTSAAIAGSQGSNVSAVEVRNAGGTGDSNLANITFHCTGAYGTSLHLRADGYMGMGGWSASTWRWYTYLVNGDMTAAGNVTAYSDPRLKTDITPIDSALSIIGQLNGVRFKWIESSVIGHPGEYDYGVLADQVQKVLPELVADSIHEAPEGDKYKTVAYDKFAPILIEAVKELTDKVAALEAKLEQLTKDKS